MDKTIYEQNKKRLLKSGITYGVMTVVFALLLIFIMQFQLLNRQYTDLLIQIAYYVILAVSLNLVCGFLGELSLGHAGFMSIGAYIGSIITTKFAENEVNWLVAILVAFVAGGMLAAVFGLIFRLSVLRLRGDYLAIVTLAFGEIVKSIVNFLSVTGGPGGLKNFTNYTSSDHYLLVFLVVALSVVFLSNLIKTRQGRAIRAVRDNAIAAEAMGIAVNRIRVYTFVISAFFAGIAGVIYANSTNIIKPTHFDYNMSIDVLVIAVLGGLGNIKGSIVAVIILTVLPEALRPLKDYRMLIYSIALIAIMLFNNSSWKKQLLESDRLPAFLKRNRQEGE